MSVKINTRFVRQRMLDLGWEQKDLAAAANLTEATISRLLNGSDFTSRTLGLLSAALQCAPVDLIQVGATSPLVDAQAASSAVA